MVRGRNDLCCDRARRGYGDSLATRACDWRHRHGRSVQATAFAEGCAERRRRAFQYFRIHRSEEHTSELQSLTNLVCRLLLEKKKPSPNPGIEQIRNLVPQLSTTELSSPPYV